MRLPHIVLDSIMSAWSNELHAGNREWTRQLLSLVSPVGATLMVLTRDNMLWYMTEKFRDDEKCGSLDYHGLSLLKNGSRAARCINPDSRAIGCFNNYHIRNASRLLSTTWPVPKYSGLGGPSDTSETLLTAGLHRIFPCTSSVSVSDWPTV
jgi:hypothetical protein